MTDDTMTEGMTGPGTTIDETKGLDTMTDGMRGPGTTTGEMIDEVVIDESKFLFVPKLSVADNQLPARREA